MDIVLLNIEETSEAIKRWIESSVRKEHLSLCHEAVDTFIIERFKYHNERYRYESELLQLLIQKENTLGL